MCKNIGKTDRIIRLILGFTMSIVGINFGFTILGIFHIVVGLALALSGFFGWCPIYSIFKFSTKGSGIDKITTTQIKNAVRENKIEVKTKTTKKKVVKKSNTKKKVTKKPAVKKKTTSKK